MNTKLVPCTVLNCKNQTLASEGTISQICKDCLHRVLWKDSEEPPLIFVDTEPRKKRVSRKKI